MKTPFNTEEQKKRAQMIGISSALIGFAVGFGLAFFLGNKTIKRLEAKIFKLEGWQ